jgi:hypothetical protein
LPVGKVNRESAPFDAIISPIEDGIEYGSQIDLTLFADRLWGRQKLLNPLPFGIIEVAGVAHNNQYRGLIFQLSAISTLIRTPLILLYKQLLIQQQQRKKSQMFLDESIQMESN